MRNGRRLFALIAVSCALFTACRSNNDTGTAGTASAPTTTIEIAAPATPAAIATTVKESAFVRAVNLKSHQITIDPMEFLTGQAAINEFKRANPKAHEGPDNDYYIVNRTKDHVVLPLESNAIVRVVQAGGTVHTNPVRVTQRALVRYPSLSIHPFWITIERGKVTGVEEQFVP